MGIGLVGVKHPDNMNRKEKLQMISAISRTEGRNNALRFWLIHCPRISRKAFEEQL